MLEKTDIKTERNESRALAVPTRDEWQMLLEQARIYHASGLLPAHIQRPEQALLIIQTGRELGIPPLAALRGIQVIQGTPTVSPQLMLALVQSSGKLAHFEIVESTDERCTVRVQRKGFPVREETFTIDDAKRIMTKERDKTIPLAEKYNWRAMPKVMLRWRAIAAALRIDFADVVLGLYTPEELGADVDVVDDDLPTQAAKPGSDVIDADTDEASVEELEAWSDLAMDLGEDMEDDETEDVTDADPRRRRSKMVAEIIGLTTELGFNRSWLDRKINKRYETDGGLDALGFDHLAEVKGILERALARRRERGQ